ncbi:MAG: trigger factor [Fimbriimonas ginsengisoli]|uniref:Trigger factor n=1 Tax=Fimbriimonas ginsengisoli TaxID=1005039 RepID=A0A931LWU1_FIMGI|nr:trigger factor [Fimbriimonas ginsengisoli]
MQITREDLNPCTVKLDIVCDRAEVEKGFAKAVRALSTRVKIPGFRPGHAPVHLVEAALDPAILREEAVEQIVRETYQKVLTEQAIVPDPSVTVRFELEKASKEEGVCQFWVKVPLPPKVELGDLDGLTYEAPDAEPTDQEVDHQIEELRRKRSTREAVTDRGAQEGDICVLNIKEDGVAGEGRTFMTVVGQTFAQLDLALEGMRAEEMKSLSVTFPPNFQEKDWADKTVDVQLTLNSVSAVRLPELDENFAKALKSDSPEALRDQVRKLIGEAKAEASREIATEKLFDELLARSTVNVSDGMWEALAERRMRETAEEQAKAGKTLEQYAQEMGMTLEQFSEAWREKARTSIERALVVREVYAREKMSLGDADLNRELVEMAREFAISPVELLEILKKNQAIEELRFRALSRMVGDFLIERAQAREPAGAVS